MIEYFKLCPTCSEKITYKSAQVLKESVANNRNCRKCFRKVPGFVEKLSKGWFQKGHRPSTADNRKGKSWEEIYGVEKAKEIKLKRSQKKQPITSNIQRSIACKNAGCGTSNKGRKCSEENKKASRLLMVERLKATHQNFHPPYNKLACEHFNKLMIEEGIHTQHALNGGEYHIKELGYWIDGYDKTNNIVYEFDEKTHFKVDGVLKEKDIKRQKEIEDFLKCKFIRIKWTDIQTL